MLVVFVMLAMVGTLVLSFWFWLWLQGMALDGSVDCLRNRWLLDGSMVDRWFGLSMARRLDDSIVRWPALLMAGWLDDIDDTHGCITV